MKAFLLVLIILLCVITILSDLAFLRTATLEWKYVYWTSLILASAGTTCYTIAGLIHKYKADDKAEEHKQSQIKEE